MSSKSSIQLKALSPLKTVILSVTGMLMDITFAWRKDILCRTMLPATLFTLLIHLTSTTASMRIEVASPMPPIKEPMGSQFMLQVVVRLDIWCHCQGDNNSDGPSGQAERAGQGVV